MNQSIKCNAVNVLYYLYFKNRELVYHFERMWSEDGMSYTDDEYSYIFLGLEHSNFHVDLKTYFFLRENDIIELTSGNECESIFMITDYYKKMLSTVLKEKDKKFEQIY